MVRSTTTDFFARLKTCGFNRTAILVKSFAEPGGNKSYTLISVWGDSYTAIAAASGRYT